MGYTFDSFGQYQIDLWTAAMNATMNICGYGGSVDKGFDGGNPPVRVTPLGGHYEGSTFVNGGKVTDPTGQYVSTLVFGPGWPFHDLQGMSDYYWKQINEIFDDWWWIPTPHAGYTPGFDAPIASARSAASDLAFRSGSVETAGSSLFGGNPALGSALDNLDEDLTGLDGQAIRTFKLLYADPLIGVTASQEAVACALWIAVYGEQKVWERARQGIADIAGQGAEAMRHAKGGGGGGLDVLLDVVGSVADIAGLIPGVGTGPQIVSTVTSVLKTAYSHVPQGKPESVPLGGDFPGTVLDKIRGAVKTLNDQIRAEEEGIRSAMASDQSTVTDGTESRSFELGTPQLLSDDRAQDFRTVNDVAIGFSNLAFAANTIMPMLSNIYSGASKALSDVSASSASWQRPAGIGLGSTGPYDEVSSLASTLSQYLAANAGNIDAAATKLGIVARDFHKTEGQIQADLDAHRRAVRAAAH